MMFGQFAGLKVDGLDASGVLIRLEAALRLEAIASGVSSHFLIFA